MRKWARATLGAVAAAGIASVAFAAPANAAGSAPPSPSTSHTSAQQTAAAGNGFFNASGVNIRTGPSTNRTILGQGFEGQRIQVHCDRAGGGGWWNVTNLATGVSGYVYWPADPKPNVLLDYGTPDPPTC